MLQIEQFNDIYVKYYRKAYRFSLMYVRNDQAAEDIATESLIKLWETMNKETVEKPLVLLLAILKHKSQDYLRVQISHKERLEAMAEWRRRELSIRISTLEGCTPDYLKSIMYCSKNWQLTGIFRLFCMLTVSNA